MENKYRYFDFSPMQALIYFISSSLKIEMKKLHAVLGFQSKLESDTNKYELFILKNETFTKVNNALAFDWPNRQEPSNKNVVMKKLTTCPDIVQSLFQPQKEMMFLVENNTAKEDKYAVQLNFLNPKDDKWDYIFLLIDESLAKAIAGIFQKHKLSVINKKNGLPEIETYFNMVYKFYEDFYKVEFSKYDVTIKMASTIASLTKMNSELELQIQELKSSLKSDLLNVVENKIRREFGFDTSLELAESAFMYINEFKGNEQELIKAVIKAADLTLNIYNLTGGSLMIEKSHIEIFMNKGKFTMPGKNDKRLERAKHYLNVYERAAQILKNRNQDININTLAANVRPPVKPPAISAITTNYRKEIIQSLNTFPLKWQVLRKNYKPLVELLANKK